MIEHGRLYLELDHFEGMQEFIIRWMLSSKQLHLSSIELKPRVSIWSDTFVSSSLMLVESAFFLMYILRLAFFFLRQEVFTVNNTLSWSLIPGTTLIFSMMLELLERIRRIRLCPNYNIISKLQYIYIYIYPNCNVRIQMVRCM